MWQTKRIGVAVYPRQSGKDVGASMEQCAARLKNPKTTGVYISLNNPMIRDILWDKTYLDPRTGKYVRMLQDNVPSNEAVWRDSQMTGHFRNKSRLKLQGYFQSGQDMSGVGTSFQDYTITELALYSREDPIPRMMPIIENDHENKRLMVVSTPRGKRRNPLWQLLQSKQGDPDFQVLVRTIDDLNEMMRRNGMDPILSAERLEQIRDTYLRRFGNDRMFEQEYYCSFEEMDAAAVYGEAYSKLLEEKRDIDFNLDSTRPVYVMFDIGSAGMHSDATAWLAFQWFNNRMLIYDCAEGHGRPLPDYVNDLRMKPWFPKLDHIILPWDAEHHEVSISETPADMLRKVFPRVAVLAKSHKVFRLSGARANDPHEITDVQRTRMALYNMIIHKTNCDWLLECLENFKFEYNPKLQEWSDKPLHDKYSHMMDALRYAVQSTKELDVFNGAFFDVGPVTRVSDYVEDWSVVWGRK